MANRVLVVGDIMLDQYVFGEVNRISPEAPVPILTNTHDEHRLGGAGNVALNLSKLGVETTLLSIQGDDIPSYFLSTHLTKADITNFAIKDEDNTTITKCRFVSNNHQILRMDNEKKFTKESQQQLFVSYSGLGDCYDVIIFSDYNKGTLSLLTDMIELGKSSFIIIDPKGTDWYRYRGADLITPNRKELDLFVKSAYYPRENPEVDAFYILQSLNIKNMLLTESENGATLYSIDGTVKHYEAKAQQVIDVTGAGDTVVATIAYGLSNNLTLDESIELSMSAAGVVVSKFGTSYVTKEELNHQPH